MPPTRNVSLRLENFKKVHIHTGKFLSSTPSEYIYACKPPAVPQIWYNSDHTNKVEAPSDESQGATSLERYLWVGFALPRKLSESVLSERKLKWAGQGLQAVARCEADGTLKFYVLAPVKNDPTSAKVPLMVASNKIFFFPRFRDDSTSFEQRKVRWSELCKRAALRIARLPSIGRSPAVEDRLLPSESQQSPTKTSETSSDTLIASIGSEPISTNEQPVLSSRPQQASAAPLEPASSHDESHAKLEPIDGSHEIFNISEIPLEQSDNASGAWYDQSQAHIKGESPAHIKGESRTTSRESSTANGLPYDRNQSPNDDIKPDLPTLSASSEPSPNLPNHPNPVTIQAGASDPQVKVETKPGLLDENPGPEPKLHPFFDLRPSLNLNLRPHINPSAANTTPSTALEAELLKSPTDAEWATIQQKTDSLKAAFGLTFEPHDILLVQRFLTMRKISFPEQTVRDLTHLLHHKLYNLRPPRSQSGRIKVVRGVIEDMVVMHIGRCLERKGEGGQIGEWGASKATRPKQEPPKPADPLTQKLAARVSSDAVLKALVQDVAKGNASPSQLQVYRDLLNELHESIKPEPAEKALDTLASTSQTVLSAANGYGSLHTSRHGTNPATNTEIASRVGGDQSDGNGGSGVDFS